MNIHHRGFGVGSALPEGCGSVTSVKPVNLALQGGGAHAAFAWGVLDRLLEDPRIAFEGISATSTGAANAAVLAYGFTVGGREGAKRALANFWRRVAHAAPFSPLQPSLASRLGRDHGLEGSPMHLIFDVMSRLPSPYQFNPLNYNPLRKVLEASIDFERIRRGSAIKLFLAAANARTGKVKIFRDSELTAKCVLASACLPFLFQAVEVEGEYYWDGCYLGNPALFPLVHGCDCRDVLVVHINPVQRDDVPTTARDIMNRVNEISFNASLMREMQAMASVATSSDRGRVNGGEIRRMLVHAIAADDVMRRLGVASKLSADWEFLTCLRDIGRDRAETWLAKHFDRIGTESTVDISETCR